jgi:hypothetical protein
MISPVDPIPQHGQIVLPSAVENDCLKHENTRENRENFASNDHVVFFSGYGEASDARITSLLGDE